MIKLLIFLSSIFLPSTQAQEAPPQTYSFTGEAHFFVFKSLDKFQDLSFQGAYRFNEALNDQKFLQVGHRYRFNKNWKGGLFLRRDYGLRHNEDWDNGTGQWKWRDTTDRGETTLSPFIQYKSIVANTPFLIYKLRLQYNHNFFNDQEEVQLKTGLIAPLTSTITWVNQVEVFVPTNYSRQFIDEYWYYSALSWKLLPQIFIGPQVTLGVQKWTESLAFKDISGNTFENENKVLRLGFHINFYL